MFARIVHELDTDLHHPADGPFANEKTKALREPYEWRWQDFPMRGGGGSQT